MPILRQIIGQMSREEVRAFKIFLHRIQTSGDRKVELLFDMLRDLPDEAEPDEEKMIKKLFGQANRNAFYQLKKRLRDYLDRSRHDFLFGRDELKVLQILGLARYAFQQQQYPVCWDYLKKARKMAVESTVSDALEMVLTEMIKTAVFIPGANPEALIEERSQVRKKLSALKELDEILTVLGYRLAISQQTGSNSIELSRTLEAVMEKHLHDPELKADATLRLRLIEGVSQVLLQQHAYAALAAYLEKALNQAEADRLFNKQNHELRLKLLTWLTNALFKSEQLETSLRAAERLRLAMEEYDGFLSDKYFIFYNSAMVYVNSVINLPEAIRILEETIANPALEKHPMYSLVVHLNLALCLHNTAEPRKAMKVLSRLSIHPAYPQTDNAFRIKIGLSELILRAELEQWDLAGTRAQQLQREIEQSGLDETQSAKQSGFVKIIQQLARRDGDLSKPLQTRIRSWIAEYGGASPESDVINYSAWLISRFAPLIQ